jgi:hypothetical protein
MRRRSIDVPATTVTANQHAAVVQYGNTKTLSTNATARDPAIERCRIDDGSLTISP